MLSSRSMLRPAAMTRGPAQEGAPFATLERARDAIRGLKSPKGLPAGGVRIVLHNGTYRLERTRTLDPEDSGTRSHRWSMPPRGARSRSYPAGSHRRVQPQSGRVLSATVAAARSTAGSSGRCSSTTGDMSWLGRRTAANTSAQADPIPEVHLRGVAESSKESRTSGTRRGWTRLACSTWTI